MENVFGNQVFNAVADMACIRESGGHNKESKSIDSKVADF